MHRIAVVMAGGRGERFWPLSRENRPKQLLVLTDPSMSMLEEAVRRIEPLVGSTNVYLATSSSLRDTVSKTGLVPGTRTFAEPDRRNTLGALVWTAASLMALMPKDWMDLTVAVLTADHKIATAEAFRGSVAKALQLAEDTSGLVTIGIRPTRPETGFGYVEVGEEAGLGRRVTSFREKPTVDVAKQMVAAGSFLWNSGMFFWTLRAFVEELTDAMPAAADAITQIAHALVANDEQGALEAFRSLPNLSIDYALMEKSANVFVVEAEFNWDDVGAWDALHRSRPLDESGNVISGNVVQMDTRDSVVINDADSLTTCVLGVEDMIVITTRDAVLICPKSRAQDVKKIVDELKARDSQDIL